MTSASHLKKNHIDSNSSTVSIDTSVPPPGNEEAIVEIKNVQNIKTFMFTYEGSKMEKDENTSISTRARAVEKLIIKIPELMRGDYSYYTWPCAPILAHFLWEHRQVFINKRVLEIGAGTGLPGILAAKCGAQVILSDDLKSPRSLKHLRRACKLNNLEPDLDVKVTGISFGILVNSVFRLGPLDYIIASDCFYDPLLFEDILITVSFLLHRNNNAKFLYTYQERSADWSIEALLMKWKLTATPLNMSDIGKSSGLCLSDIAGNHTIHLLQITRDSYNES